MVRKLLIVVMVLMASSGWSAPEPTERRTAEALFRQVDGCIEVTTLVTMIENAVVQSEAHPDGWRRAAWLTVEQNDTCAGIQLLNAAGQVVTIDLTIDRKLAGAYLSSLVTVWDGISQQQGEIMVTVDWEGEGTIHRHIWRTLERSATALLAADGMGLSLRDSSTSARISIAK